MLTMREQDELVPVGTSWQRPDGGIDVVLSDRWFRDGEMFISYASYWRGVAGQGYGDASAVHFAGTRRRLERAPEWTGVR